MGSGVGLVNARVHQHEPTQFLVSDFFQSHKPKTRKPLRPWLSCHTACGTNSKTEPAGIKWRCSDCGCAGFLSGCTVAVSSFGFRVSSFSQKCEVGRGELPQVFTAEARRAQRKIRQVVFETESRGSRGIGVGSRQRRNPERRGEPLTCPAGSAILRTPGRRGPLRAILLSLRLGDPALSRLYTDGRRQKRIGLSTTPRRKRHVRHRHYGAETAQGVPPLELSLRQ